MRETLISVDVETAGPNPSSYSLLSIGACLIDDPEAGFYVELKPVNDKITAESLSIAGLSPERLAETGQDPVDAMTQFEAWVHAVVVDENSPVFVGFNAAFDWMFVNDYFERFLGRNPFGHAALDIKSYYLGVAGGSWAETSLRFLSPRYLEGRELSHNALGDARDQAALFSAITLDATNRRKPTTKRRTP